MEREGIHKSIFFSISDFTGIIASTLCFIHCWTLPALLIFLPGLMVHIEWVHPVLGSIAILSTIPLLVKKSYKNQSKSFLIALITGNLMLLIILLGHEHLHFANEILISTLGGLLLVFVHFKNLRLSQNG